MLVNQVQIPRGHCGSSEVELVEQPLFVELAIIAIDVESGVIGKRTQFSLNYWTVLVLHIYNVDVVIDEPFYKYFVCVVVMRFDDVAYFRFKLQLDQEIECQSFANFVGFQNLRASVDLSGLKSIDLRFNLKNVNFPIAVGDKNQVLSHTLQNGHIFDLALCLFDLTQVHFKVVLVVLVVEYFEFASLVQLHIE